MLRSTARMQSSLQSGTIRAPLHEAACALGPLDARPQIPSLSTLYSHEMQLASETLRRHLAGPGSEGALPPLQRAEAVLQQLASFDKPISDLMTKEEDGKELQWVDLALGGGVVLGIATAGYVYALEAAGIRFRGIAGTSSGGIVATFTAALRPEPAGRCGDTLVEKMFGLKFNEVPDGDVFERQLWGLASKVQGGLNAAALAKLLAGAFNPLTLGYAPALVGVFKLLVKKGIHPGDYLQGYLRQALVEVGVHTMRDLKSKCRLRRPLQLRTGGAYPGNMRDSVVAVLTGDVSQRCRALLTWELDPGMTRPVNDATRYWAHPDDVEPSEFVRRTLSVPIFFYPRPVKVTGTDKGNLEEAVLVDGAVVDYFPIDVFHVPSNAKPFAPTFGFDVISRDGAVGPTASLAEYLVSTLSTLATATEDSFLGANPDYQLLIASLKTKVNLADWGLSDCEKRTLFVQGMEAAAEFLQGFNWTAYQARRAALAQLMG